MKKTEKPPTTTTTTTTTTLKLFVLQICRVVVCGYWKWSE
jgi:hypothetical protein